MDDSVLENQIKSLQSSIEKWAKKNSLWNDSLCCSWMDNSDEEPSTEEPCLLVIRSDGEIADLLYQQYDAKLHEEFEKLLNSFGCYYSLWSQDEAHIWFDGQDDMREAYNNYFQWQWICSLLEPDFSDLYEEVYQWFSQHPEDLYNLHHRKFEIVLDGIFRNNGFRTELGPGRADGGVDIRLYSNDVVGEVVTLVQAKKYKKELPIDLQAVQALSGAVYAEGANRGLFITTSRYLPCAHKFTARQDRRITLADSRNVQVWASDAHRNITKDKSKVIEREYIESLLQRKPSSGLEGKILHARWGVTMVLNSFVLVLKESKGAILAVEIPSKSVRGDCFIGEEVPSVGLEIVKDLTEDNIFRAKKGHHSDGRLYASGNGKLYSMWDQQPQHYDRLD